jgi:hypothetical protein
MTRKLIATILAASMAITSINVGTAQAGDREVARILFGATALAIIGTALAAEQRKQEQATVKTHTPRYQQHYKPQHQPRPDHGHAHKKPAKKNHYRPAVSRNCLMTVRGYRGWTEGYAVRCAQRTTRATLPSDCVRRNYAQGPRLFYSPVCLRRNGFNA